jgi:hypothetical protein
MAMRWVAGLLNSDLSDNLTRDENHEELMELSWIHGSGGNSRWQAKSVGRCKGDEAAGRGLSKLLKRVDGPSSQEVRMYGDLRLRFMWSSGTCRQRDLTDEYGRRLESFRIFVKCDEVLRKHVSSTFNEVSRVHLVRHSGPPSLRKTCHCSGAAARAPPQPLAAALRTRPVTRSSPGTKPGSPVPVRADHMVYPLSGSRWIAGEDQAQALCVEPGLAGRSRHAKLPRRRSPEFVTARVGCHLQLSSSIVY